MKKLARIISILCCIICLIGNTVNAAESGAVMNAYTRSDSVVLFVKNPGRDIDHVYLGNDEAQKFTTEDVGAVRTVVILDNSLSINKKYREAIKAFLTDLVASRKDGDTFTIATFAEGITYLVQESNDYLNIKKQIDQLEFVNQDSYFVNTLYTVINDIGSYEDIKYTRVIVIADGVDNEALGYTDEELNRKIQTIKVPIYAIGCRGEEENLKKMFALSRSSNAKSYLFDEISGTDILQDIAQDMDVVKINVVPQDKSCDGISKAVRVSYGEDYCTADVVMPFKAIEETQPETKEEVVTVAEETKLSVTEPLTIETEEQPMEMEAVAEKGSIPIILLGVGAAVLIIVIIIIAIVIIILEKRKPKKKASVDISKIGHSSNTAMTSENQGGGTELLGGNSGGAYTDKTSMMSGNRSIQLILQDMDNPSKTFEYPLRDRILVGRDGNRCQIVISYSKFVSSVHCEILVKGNNLYVRDGGSDVIASTNGTFVNGQKATPEQPLPSGAILKLGQVRFKVTYR